MVRLTVTKPGAALISSRTLPTTLALPFLPLYLPGRTFGKTTTELRSEIVSRRADDVSLSQYGPRQAKTAISRYTIAPWRMK